MAARTMAARSAGGGGDDAGRSPIADERKAAVAGRDESRVIRRYLEALEVGKPRRGRPRSIDGLQRQLDKVRLQIIHADPMTRVRLAEERVALEAELRRRTSVGVADFQALEAAFVQSAAAFSARKGIGYVAWRSAGVPASVLKRAGITRARG